MKTNKHRWMQAVVAMATVAALWWVGNAVARPPTGGGGSVVTRPPTSGGPTTTTPPSGTGSGNLNWQGLVGGITRGVPFDRTRPSYVRPTPTIPLRPVIPSRPLIIPENTPQYVVPQPTETMTTTTVIPQPNLVVLKVPQLAPPLSGRFWQVSIREARCYASQLQAMADHALTDAETEFANAGGDLKMLGAQVDQVRQMLGRGAAWREIEPVLKLLFEQNDGTFSPKTRERFTSVLQFLLVRDGFVVVGSGAPRGRGTVITSTGIPTGLIWVLYDPTLPVGVGLLVNDYIIVCGTGGKGDLSLLRTSAAAGLGLPVGVGEPLPDVAAAEKAPSKDGIGLRCSQDAGNAVNYVLNSAYRYTMQPGSSQELAGDQQWIIEFDRGGGQGAARYTLGKGWYEFRIVEGHWGLFKMNLEIVIDNREGTQDFQYLAENKIVTVKAGETSSQQTQGPLFVEFDRGLGSDAPARKNLNKSGTYKVAVDPDSNNWDLFAAKQSNIGKGATQTALQ